MKGLTIVFMKPVIQQQHLGIETWTDFILVNHDP